MNTKRFTMISSANTRFQATHLQETIEKAGIPVTIRSSIWGMALLVPTELAAKAQALLDRQPSDGEISLNPAYSIRLYKN